MPPTSSAATPASQWQDAVEAGARGRYAEADAGLQALEDAVDPWPSLALSARASHRRQIGATDDAVKLDARARERATDDLSVADACVGLAADTIAQGDAGTARAHLLAAEHEASRHWRTSTRWHWVGAEFGLLAGDPVAARAHALAAVERSRGRSVRHEAKSALVLAAVTGDVSALPGVAATVREGGWTTLVWPLALIAADHASALDPRWLAEAWAAARAATNAIEGGLPEALRTTWRDHPGVRRLRAGGPPPGAG